MLRVLPFIIAISVGTVYAQEYKYHEEYYTEEYAPEGMADAYTQGKMDAEAEVNSTLWLALGCLLGIWGVLIAYVYEPSPPAMRIVGKDPEWVALYTEGYKKGAKNKQVKNAVIGCVIGTAASMVVYCLYYYMIIAAATTTYAY